MRSTWFVFDINARVHVTLIRCRSPCLLKSMLGRALSLLPLGLQLRD
jgi:hypothetical protein